MQYTFPNYYKRIFPALQEPVRIPAAQDGRSWLTIRHWRSTSTLKVRSAIAYTMILTGNKHVFRQYNRRCAFLNEENLCDIYTEAGPEMFCRTCRNYPRHIEEFEGLREISLSLSCPEAARILLSQKRKGTLYHKRKKRQKKKSMMTLIISCSLHLWTPVICL